MIVSSVLDPVVIKTFIFSATLFTTWFTFWYRSNLARTERERAYVCTLLSSSFTSMCSVPLVYTLLTNGGDLTEILAYRTWTVIATTFFMTFLIMDLSIGFIFYRNKIEMLTGWIHHITYLGTLTWAIHNKYTAVFIMMCSLELPTFILALGSVRSSLRRDYVFATTFLLTRILFHAYAIACAWNMQPYGPVVIALSVFFPVHCFWFYGFIKQQIRLAAKRKNQSEVTPIPQQKQQQQTLKHKSKQAQHIQPNKVTTTTTTYIKKTLTQRSKTLAAPSSTSKYIQNSSSFHQQSPPVSVH